MTNANTGGSAFPSEYDGDCQYQGNKGMTLLDYFAGQALVGICANPSEALYITNIKEANTKNEKTFAETYSRQAYEYADAMIAEKHRREGKDKR